MREHVRALRLQALGHCASRIAAEDDARHHEIADAAGVRNRVGVLEAADMDALAPRVTGHDALPLAYWFRRTGTTPSRTRHNRHEKCRRGGCRLDAGMIPPAPPRRRRDVRHAARGAW